MHDMLCGHTVYTDDLTLSCGLTAGHNGVCQSAVALYDEKGDSVPAWMSWERSE